MDRRIRPWVNKKIVEYIGEDEPTLSDFICKKVISHSSPSSILADISMVCFISLWSYPAASWVKKVGGAKSYNFLTDSCRQFPTEDIMGARNFNFGPKILSSE